jgi:thiol-disulfide isomerase/thioredoxin
MLWNMLLDMRATNCRRLTFNWPAMGGTGKRGGCSRVLGRIVLGCILLSVAPLRAQADLVAEIRSQLAQNDWAGADSRLRNYKAQHGVTPEYLEGLSWMARGAAAAKQWFQAVAYAGDARRLCEERLASAGARLDAEPHLPIALGAAYEVLAQALAADGKSAEGLRLLRSARERYRNTSISARLQKNINLLALPGQPAPALEAGRYLGSKPPALASLRGDPVLLFFWAHWCADCKAEVPVLARLQQEFAPQGLVIIGPTQLYGYAAQGEDATPDQERAYIESVRVRYYGSLLDMPVPLSQHNFASYGASTTPTLVLLNRAGRVSMYHPGAMSYEDLRAALQTAAAR